ncbi:10923_t:CDS:2, partial [Gigaspora margarita]
QADKNQDNQEFSDGLSREGKADPRFFAQCSPIQIFTDVSDFTINNHQPYLQQAHKLAQQNNIDLKIK